MPSQSELKDYATQEANAYGVPPQLFSNLIQAESGWNPFAVSNKGAEGIAQLMPGTAPDINRFNPYQSIERAAQLLRSYFDKFGSWDLALAAYNAGPGAVSKYGNVPPYPETESYIRKILGGSSNETSAAGGTILSGLKIVFWAAVIIVALVVVRGVTQK